VAVASTYNNIGFVHEQLGNFQKALEYYEKSLEINIKSLRGAHVNVAGT
jgi:tetratricopeptide (TPR) repeat protein